MPVSSLIIRTEKDKTQVIAEQLNACQEATVSEIQGDNIILVTETKAQSDDRMLWDTIEKISGVLHCDLIYHNFEDEEGS